MSSDEENDQVQDLAAIRDKMMSLPLSERMQVSAWEDDNTGVESSRYPTGYVRDVVYIFRRSVIRR